MALPAGSRLPALVQTAMLARDPLRFLGGLQRRHGHIFTVKLLGAGDTVYVVDPDLARQVFAADRDIGLAGAARRPYLAPVVGESSILCTDGETWQRQRRLLGPPFHGEAVARYRDQIAEIAAADIERWPRGEPFALRPRMQEVTLEIILRVVFGIDDVARVEQARPLLRAPEARWVVWMPPRLRDALERLRRSGDPLGRLNPWSRFVRVRDQADAILYDEIARRRADPALGERIDVLSLLLQARDEDGSALADTELRDELVTLVAAGHETTATALAWLFERLARHPEALVRAREEPAYLEAAIRETLRVRPVLFDVIRVLEAPLRLDGYDLPAGTFLAPALGLLQRLPDVYPEPDAFRPERFLGDDAPTYPAWAPFGGGRRRCVGAQLAMLELRTIAGEVLRRLDLRPEHPAPERPRLEHITLVPARGARVVAQPRSAAAVAGAAQQLRAHEPV